MPVKRMVKWRLLRVGSNLRKYVCIYVYIYIYYAWIFLSPWAPFGIFGLPWCHLGHLYNMLLIYDSVTHYASSNRMICCTYPCVHYSLKLAAIIACCALLGGLTPCSALLGVLTPCIAAASCRILASILRRSMDGATSLDGAIKSHVLADTRGWCDSIQRLQLILQKVPSSAKTSRGG